MCIKTSLKTYTQTTQVDIKMQGLKDSKVFIRGKYNASSQYDCKMQFNISVMHDCQVMKVLFSDVTVLPYDCVSQLIGL